MYSNNTVSTAHALKRAQSRGIKDQILDFVNIYGEDIPAAGGAFIRRLTKEGIQMIRSEIGKTEFAKIEKKLKAYIVRQGTKVVTAGYQTQRFRT